MRFGFFSNFGLSLLNFAKIFWICDVLNQKLLQERKVQRSWCERRRSQLRLPTSGASKMAAVSETSLVFGLTLLCVLLPVSSMREDSATSTLHLVTATSNTSENDGDRQNLDNLKSELAWFFEKVENDTDFKELLLNPFSSHEKLTLGFLDSSLRSSLVVLDNSDSSSPNLLNSSLVQIGISLPGDETENDHCPQPNLERREATK